MTIRRCSGGWRALPLARILNPAGNRDRSPAYALFLPTRTMNNEPTLSAARLPQKFPGTERVDGHEIEPSRPTWRAGARAHRALARGPRPYAHMQTAGIRCYVFEHPAGHLRQAGSQASPVLPNSAPVNEHPAISITYGILPAVYLAGGAIFHLPTKPGAAAARGSADGASKGRPDPALI